MRREQGYLDEAAGHVTLLRGCESLVGLVLIDDRETRGRKSRFAQAARSLRGVRRLAWAGGHPQRPGS